MGRRLKASDPSKATRHKTEPVEVRNIAHPKVWKTAIKLAEGDKTLITVDTYSRVTVLLRS